MSAIKYDRSVRAAVATGKWDEIISAYRAAWEAGESPAADVEIVGQILRRHAEDDVRDFDAARRTFASHIDTAVERGWLGDQDDSAYIFACVLHPEELGDGWLRARNTLAATGRKTYVQQAVRAFCDIAGREAARVLVPRWWRECQLEEEREALIEALADRSALSFSLLVQLGPAALAHARHLVDYERISPDMLRDDERGRVRAAPGANPVVDERLSDLVSVTTLPLSIRDARFPPAPRPSGRARLLERTLRRMRHYGPYWDEFTDDLRTMLRGVLSHTDESGDVFAFPLIRLLHLRLILEQPELRAALNTSGRFLNPDVMHYVLGRDAVVYVPQIRVNGGAERRWRATWAESMGEALASMILEDRVGLDLITLARIPEASEATPDFIAETADHARIVFEAKGSTDWKTHRDQRTKARRQLRKDAGSATSWASTSRAYACCFLGAREGTSSESLLHVEDPPFAFDALFEKGWREAAMRRHFAAVLGAAGLPQAAGAVLTRNRAREIPHDALIVGTGERAVTFNGTYRNLAPVAEELGHPEPWIFERIRMFTGVDSSSFGALVNDRFPSWADRIPADTDEDAGAPAFLRLPSAAPLEQDETREGGVYSVLADGAILAFEVQRRGSIDSDRG